MKSFAQPQFVRIVRDAVREEMNELLAIAANITETCYKMYVTTKSGTTVIRRRSWIVQNCDAM